MHIPTPSVFTAVVNQYLTEPHASLLNGIIFGTPLKTDPQFYDAVRRVGLLHLVVLSGMNITILCSLIGVLTSSLPKKLSILLSIAGVVLFTFFVGPQPPIVRAALMGILSLFAILTGRKAVPLYVLFVSLILFLIFSPQSLEGISFQLSYAATLGLILFSKPRPVKESWIKKSALAELRTSLSAQVFTTPLLFFYFRQISFIAPLSNVLVAWTVVPLMVFGFLTALLGKIHFTLGTVPSLISYGFLQYDVLIIETLAKLPFASITF